MLPSGGPSLDPLTLYRMTKNDTLRLNFLSSLLITANDYKFEGFDLAWPFPAVGRSAGVYLDPSVLLTLAEAMAETLKGAAEVLSFSVSLSPDVDFVKRLRKRV